MQATKIQNEIAAIFADLRDGDMVEVRTQHTAKARLVRVVGLETLASGSEYAFTTSGKTVAVPRGGAFSRYAHDLATIYFQPTLTQQNAKVVFLRVVARSN